MSPHLRSVVLALLILVFFFLGGGAVLYAQGWRVRLDPLAASKVGGIYVRTYPTDAEVKINGKPIDNTTGIFERGNLAGNLFPGNYELYAHKDGFADWHSNLAVEESKVISRTHIVLIPLQSRLATSGIVSLKSFNNDWAAVLPGKKILWRNRVVTGDSAVASLGNGQALITKSKDGYYLTQSDSASSTNITKTLPRLNLLPKTNPAIISLPGSGLSFLIWSSSSLSLANPVTGRPALLENNAKDISAVAVSDNRIAWTKFDTQKKISYVSMYDLSSETVSLNLDLVPGRVSSMIFSGRNSLIMLEDGGSLYEIAPGEGTRIKVSENVKAFSYFDQSSSLAFVDESGLNITSSRKDYTFLRLPDPNNVRLLIWNKDGYHIFVVYPQKTLFVSLEDTSGEAFPEIAPTANVAYSEANNTLNFLQAGDLRAITLPE